MTDGYRASVGEILPEDDLRPAYQGAFDADEKARLDAFMNSVLDENASATPTAERPTQVIPSQEADDVETPWYAQRTNDNLAEIEGEGLADLASGVASVGKDLWRGSSEAVPQIFGGFIDALDEAAAALQSIIPMPGVQLFDDEGNLSPSFISASDMTDSFKAGETLFDMIAPKDADSVTGGFIRAGSQFLTGMIPAFRAARAMGAGRLAASYAGGAVADALVFDPHEARLSTFLNEVPVLKEIVPDYLAETGEENQTEWEGRLKNAIEGAGLGGLTDGLLKAFKVYRAQRRLAPQAEAEGGVAAIARDAEREAAEREIGSVITDDDLRPLGDPSDNAPLVIEARPDETLSASLSRLREADERAARMVDQGDALGKVQQIIEGKKRSFKRKTINDGRPIGGGEVPNEGLVPANIYEDGKVYIGNKGELHFSISDRYPHEMRGDPVEVGFLTPDGDFLDRKAAFKWVEKNEKKIKSTDGLGTETGDEWLDAADYREQVGSSSTYKRVNPGAAKGFINTETGEHVRLADDQSNAPEGMRNVIVADGSQKYIPEEFLSEIAGQSKKTIDLPTYDDLLPRGKYSSMSTDDIAFETGNVDLSQTPMNFYDEVIIEKLSPKDVSSIHALTDKQKERRIKSVVDKLVKDGVVIEALPHEFRGGRIVNGEFVGLANTQLPREFEELQALQWSPSMGRTLKTEDLNKLIRDSFEKNRSRRMRMISSAANTQNEILTEGAIRRDAIDDALDELRSGAVTKAKFPARPVASIVRDIGGIDPTSSLAGDLRSRGITSRTFPGLFRKGGVGSLDNIPGTEHQLFLEQGRVNADGYIDQQAFVDGLEAELKGEPWRTAEQRKLIDEIVAPAQELEEQMSRLGIDYENMSNDAVKARLKEIADEQEAWANYQERMFSRVDEMGGEVRSYIDLADEQRDIWSVEQIAEARAVGVDEAIIRAHEPNKVYINMARIKGAEDVKAVIQAVADADAAAIKDKTRGVVSNQKTITESSKEYQDLNDLIGRPPGPMSAAQAVAARKVLASSAEQVTQLAKIASSPNAGKVDLYNFRRSLSVHAAIQAEVIGARTETARALQSWAIPVGADRVRTEALNELINTNMGGDLSKLAKQVSNLNNESGIADVARQSVGLKTADALYSVYVNGLLSGPKTHLVNAMSNAAVAAYSIPERFVAEGFSNAFGNGDVVRGEAAAMAYGMVEGIRDGVRLMVLGPKAEGLADLGTLWEQFGKTEMRTQPISGAAFNLDPNTLMYKGLDLMGKIVSVPGGALERADLFFKSVNYRMELHALAFREASLSGAEGKEFAEKMADIMRNPPTHLHEQANKMALVNTFTNQLGPLGQSGQRFVSNTPLRWAIPFVRTPTNIMKYTFERTPLALASSSIRADLAAGGARASQAQARIALGTMLMMTFGGLAVDGHISGGGPLDPKQRQAWELEGWQPYSVKIGDTWFAYDRLDPLGMMIGIAGDLVDLIGNPQGDASNDMVFLAAITAVTQNLASKTYMSGAFELAAAFDPRNPAGSPEKFLNRQATGLIPFSAALRQTAQGMDPIVRESRDEVTGPAGEPDALGSWLNKIINDAKRQIPGMSDTLPPVRDLFGEPLSRASGVGRAWDVLVPIEASKVKNDPVARAIIENELKPSRISRQVDKINLNAEEYDELQVIAGELLRQQLEPIVNSPGFHLMTTGPDGMQGRIITRTIQQSHDMARSMFRARNPEFREKSFNKLRQGQNKLLGN